MELLPDDVQVAGRGDEKPGEGVERPAVLEGLIHQPKERRGQLGQHFRG